jgi:Ca2+-binding RTX toxin-like protein
MRHGMFVGHGRYSGLGGAAVVAIVVALGAGCSSSSGSGPSETVAATQGEFISVALTHPPTFVASTGVLTVTVKDETAEIYIQASDSSLVVNGVQSFDASGALAIGSGTKANVKSIVVNHGALTETIGDVVILNYVNGLFGQGTATAGAVVGVVGTAVAFTPALANVLIIKGTPGNDSFAAGAGGISLNSAKPTKDITFTNAPTLDVFLGAGDDKFTAGGSAAAAFPGVFATGVSVYGGAGNDTLVEGAAPTPLETFSGGAGTDTVDYSLRPATNPISAAIDPSGLITSGDGPKIPLDPTKGATEGDVILDAEFILGGLGNDQLMGGLAGSVTLNGGLGNDTFCQGDDTYRNGSDTLVGGGGVDTVDYSQRTHSLTIVMDGKTPSGDPTGNTVMAVAAGEKDVIGADVANIKTGGTAAVSVSSITGNGLNNVFSPGPGTNTIFGLAGDDTVLEGDDSNKTGFDKFHGGAGTDTVDYTQRGVGVALIAGNFAVANLSATVTTATDETASVTANDLIMFSSQPGVYYKVSAAAAGTLTLSTLYTGNTAATANARDMTTVSGTTLTVKMDDAFLSGDIAHSEADVIDIDVENLYGGAGADVLTGNALDNDIEGNAGADTLIGLAGNDTLVGAVAAGGAEANLVHGNDLADTAESGAFNICTNIGSMGTPIAANATIANCQVAHY